MRMRKILPCLLVMVVLASAVPLAVTPAAAYEKKIPGDADENDELTKDELVNAILPYMLDEGAFTLDDVGDAAYVYAYWDGKPKEITDQAEREVTLYRPVERIVEIAILDGVRILVQLGAEDKLVATNDYVISYMFGEKGRASGYWYATPRAAPELKDLPSAGSYRPPNTELICSFKPDLVLGYGTAKDADTLQEQTSTPVVRIRASSNFEWCTETLRTVSKAVGKEERAEELISYTNERIEQITGEVSQINESERVKVFFWGWPRVGVPKTTSRYDPIDIAGGINVAREFPSSGSAEVSMEQIPVWDPDIILIHTSAGIGSTRRQRSVDVYNDIFSNPIFEGVGAVKNKKVYYIRSYHIGWDHAIGYCEVYHCAKLFYPDKFKDLDVKKEGDEIMKEFYNVDGLYTALVESAGLSTPWEVSS